MHDGSNRQLVNRAGARSVALETTLLLHGVPRDSAIGLARDLAEDVRSRGAQPALVGVVAGAPTVGMTDDELARLLARDHVPKCNTSNLGVVLSRGGHGATTVSTTMELAAAAGVRVFATGGLGGVHQDWSERPDISSDLFAFTRFPVAVVASGVKSLLNVEATREALETLGVPVVGYRTEAFPAFYLRESAAGVDASFDDIDELAQYVDRELRRTGRGVAVVQPIPPGDAIEPDQFSLWLAQARQHAGMHGLQGRGVTPALLGALHMISGGATLRANLALVRANARLAGELAVRIAESPKSDATDTGNRAI